MSNDNTLPEEVKNEIKAKAIEYRGDMHCVSCDGEETGYIAGATEYAQKWFEVFEENGRLAETIAEYAPYKVKYEQAIDIFKKMLELEHSNYDNEITLGPELINEIKSFFDGSK